MTAAARAASLLSPAGRQGRPRSVNDYAAASGGAAQRAHRAWPRQQCRGRHGRQRGLQGGGTGSGCPAAHAAADAAGIGQLEGVVGCYGGCKVQFNCELLRCPCHRDQPAQGAQLGRCGRGKRHTAGGQAGRRGSISDAGPVQLETTALLCECCTTRLCDSCLQLLPARPAGQAPQAPSPHLVLGVEAATSWSNCSRMRRPSSDRRAHCRAAAVPAVQKPVQATEPTAPVVSLQTDRRQRPVGAATHVSAPVQLRVLQSAARLGSQMQGGDDRTCQSAEAGLAPQGLMVLCLSEHFASQQSEPHEHRGFYQTSATG